MVVGSVIKWLGLGLVGAFALLSLSAPQHAYATTQAFGGIGTALSSIGKGTQTFLTGLGTGSAQLLNPLWTLRDLIYGPQAGNQVTSDVRELASTGNITNPVLQSETIQQNPQLTSSGFHYSINPSISPVPVAQANIGWSSGTTATAPLSADAVKYYQSLGVSVSPANPTTVQEQNSSNATSPNSAAIRYTVHNIAGTRSVHPTTSAPPPSLGPGGMPSRRSATSGNFTNRRTSSGGVSSFRRG